MCDPVTIGVLTAASGLMQARQQRQQGKFQEGVADYNARVAENEAQETRNVANERENVQRQRTAQLLSKQKAQLGAAGVALDFGSAEQIQDDTVALGEADALRIRSNFDQQVGALQTGAELTRNQGDFARSAGRNAAFGTLLSTGATLSKQWYTAKSAKAVKKGSTPP